MDDFKLPSKPTRKAYELEYDSLSQAAVEKLMAADVEDTTGILGVDASTAALLLRYMSWNKERLIEKYMDNANKMLVAAGVILPDPETVRPSKRPLARRTTRRSASPPKSSSGSFTCSICFDDSPDLKPLSLECGHKACSGCWEAYIESKITTEAEHVCRCMAEGCGLVAPDAFVRAAVSQDIYERFGYQYSGKELDEWAPKIERLGEEAKRTHVLFNNCYRDYAQVNARQLADRLHAAA